MYQHFYWEWKQEVQFSSNMADWFDNEVGFTNEVICWVVSIN